MIDAPEEILHPASRTLFRYWESIRGEASAPGRAMLDLKKIRAYVPYLFIFEHRFQKGFVWRLAGTRLCQLWRRELTGSDALAGWDTFERAAAVRLLDGAVRAHQPFIMRFRLISSLGHDIGAEMTGLPLRALQGDQTHVFGAIMPFRDIDALGYDRITRIELSQAKVIWTEPIPAARERPLLPSATESAAAANLRVISGGRNF